MTLTFQRAAELALSRSAGPCLGVSSISIPAISGAMLICIKLGA